MLEAVRKSFRFSSAIEITLEMNPDDYVAGYFDAIKKVCVNRLSVGIQSFFEYDLYLTDKFGND